MQRERQQTTTRKKRWKTFSILARVIDELWNLLENIFRYLACCFARSRVWVWLHKERKRKKRVFFSPSRAKATWWERRKIPRRRSKRTTQEESTWGFSSSAQHKRSDFPHRLLTVGKKCFLLLAFPLKPLAGCSRKWKIVERVFVSCSRNINLLWLRTDSCCTRRFKPKQQQCQLSATCHRISRRGNGRTTPRVKKVNQL